MRYFIGIDYGSKRIGLAVGDDETRLAMPLRRLEPRGDLNAQIEAVVEACSGYNVAGFIVGLPLNMDGSEGPQARACRSFGRQLARAAGKSVSYQDERLTTAQAQELLRPAELTHKQKRSRLDRVSAQLILQAFFDSMECHPDRTA